MNSNRNKDNLLNSSVIFAAWLIVVAAGVSASVEPSAHVVHIAYHVE